MPLITLAQAETILIDDFGPALVACDLVVPPATPATDTSPRSYLSQPIAFAAREQGAPVASPVQPTDTDLAAITQLDRFLDIARLKLLEKLVRAFVQVTWSNDTSKQDLSDYRKDLIAQLAVQRDTVKRLYGHGLGQPAGLVLDLGFAATGDLNPTECA